MRRHLQTICLIFGAAALVLGLWQLQPAKAYGVTAVGLQEDFIRVAEQVMPSVVSLKAVKVVSQQYGSQEEFFRGTPYEGAFRDFNRPVVRQRQMGQGSGIIINTMVASQGQGIGFAIPINPAKKIIEPWLK